MSEENKDAIITKAIEVLSETFTRAETLDDSARRYTSVQVAAAIYELTGVSPSVEVVFSVMTEFDYRFVIDETSTALKYVWLLKYKTN